MLNENRIKKYKELSDKIDVIVKEIDYVVLELAEKHDADFNMELAIKFHELSIHFKKEAFELENQYTLSRKEVEALKQIIDLNIAILKNQTGNIAHPVLFFLSFSLTVIIGYVFHIM